MSLIDKKPVAFVIMPFADEFTDVYEDLIRLGLDDYDVIRADSRLDERNILAKVIRGIDEADLVIADVTMLNPNVMYELGVAHALGKPTVESGSSAAAAPSRYMETVRRSHADGSRASEICD